MTHDMKTLFACALLGCALLVSGCGGTDQPTEKKSEPGKRRAALLSDLGSTATTLDAAGCSIETPRMVAAAHAELPSPSDWSSDPPTSGKHNEKWASWGRYDTKVEDRYVIHNLEHGGVALWLGDGLDTQLTSRIDETLLKPKRKWIVVPRPELTGLAAASWGTLLRCTPDALNKLGGDATVEALQAWYEATNSKQTINEARIPAYAGTLEKPRPVTDISIPRPTSPN